MMQNQAAFWTETALWRYATPHFYTLSDFPSDRRGLRAESLYPSPWQGGWWRLGDAVDYMRVASLAVLDYAAKYREDLLFNRYQSGRDVIQKYTTSPPFAYFVPKLQRDPVAPADLLLISRFGWMMAALIGAALLTNIVLLPALLAGPLGWLIQRSLKIDPADTAHQGPRRPHLKLTPAPTANSPSAE